MIRLLMILVAAFMLTAAAPAPKPELYAVNFTAAWCPNCRISDPALSRALKAVSSPAVEEVRIDITNDKTWDVSTERVIAKGVIDVHNTYLGVTGLIVLTAADTGERVSCLTARVDAEAMAILINRALARVRATPPGKRDVNDALCPPPPRRA